MRYSYEAARRTRQPDENVLEVIRRKSIANCILPFVRITPQYFQYVNTLFKSHMSQVIENKQKMSLKYYVMTPCLHQNERNRAFGMLVAGMSINVLQVCLQICCSRVAAYNFVRLYD